MEEKKVVEFFEKHIWLEKILKTISWFDSSGKKMKLSLITTWIYLMDIFIAYFRKKRDVAKKKIKDENEFYDLCAVDDEEEKKCGELLKWGLENEKVNNLAVTGPYGAGKTSFLRSFENNHREYKYLNISLASFKEDENNEKKIEENILQQILYKVNGSKMPFSRIKRIKELSFRNYLVSSLFLYLWVNLLYYLHPMDKLEPFKQLFLIKGQLDPRAKLNMSLVFIVTTLFLVYKALSFFKSFNITIKAFDSEIQLSNNNEASVFYMHLDEILYFFKKTKYDVVYFEDIDRFEKINLDLFTKLRELNGLLNQSEDIKRPINFVYAVKDDLFEESWVKEKKEIRNGNLTEIVEKEINITNENSDKLRTKFFDLIVPIIPVINVSNSYEKIIEKLKKVKNLTVSDEFDSDLRTYSYYIDDMRLINNIYNEFIVYKDNLIKINKIKPENQNEFCRTLFAFIVYKNKYPKDFSDLHFDKGIISEAFRNKNEILSDKISEKYKEIHKIKEQIESAKKEELEDLKELRMLFLFEIMRSIKGSRVFENESIEDLSLNNEKFELLVKSSNIKHKHDAGYSESYSNKGFTSFEKSLNINYNDRKNSIENKKESRIENLKKEIELINKEIYEIRELSLYECFKKYGTANILEMINNDKLLEFLLESGLIEEKSYKHYISYFYGERYSREDFDFVESVKRGKALSPSHKLSNFSEIFKDLNLSDFNKKEILNYSLIDEVIKSKLNYSTQYDNLFSQFKKNSADSIEFFYDYVKNSTIKSKAQKFLVKDIPNYWDLMIEQSNFLKEKLEEVLFSIFKYGDISDLEIQNHHRNISTFFYERENTIEILEKFWSKDSDKTKDFINKLDINVKILNPTENSEAFDYIYKNNLYDISIDNIENIVKIVCEDSEVAISNLRDRNYTTIKSTNTLKPLYNYIADKFLNYIEDVFLTIATNINEDEDAILEILDADDEFLSLEVKNKVIEKQERIYTDISKIDNKELWRNVFDSFKIQPTWGNVLNYFVYKEEKIDDVLLKFFNNIELSEELSKEKIYNIEIDKKTLDKLSEDIIRNEKINSSSFKKLALSLYTYIMFGMNNFSESRMDDIIECNIFSLKVKIVEELKKNFPEKVSKFLLSKLDLFLDKLNDYKEIIEIGDYVNVFISDVMSEEKKVKFINNFDISLLKKESPLCNELKEFLKELEILKHFNEEELVRLNNVNLLPISNEVIIKLREIDEKNEASELEKFIEDNYTSILINLNKFEFTEVEFLFLFEKLQIFEEQKLFLNSFNVSKLSKGSKLVTKLIELIIDSDNEKIEVDFEKLIIIIKNTSEETSKIKVLISQLEFLDNENIKNILRELDTPYSTLTSLRQVSMELTELNEIFLSKLEKKDIVSSYKKNEEEFTAYVKKSFLQLS